MLIPNDTKKKHFLYFVLSLVLVFYFDLIPLQDGYFSFYDLLSYVVAIALVTIVFYIIERVLEKINKSIHGLVLVCIAILGLLYYFFVLKSLSLSSYYAILVGLILITMLEFLILDEQTISQKEKKSPED